MSRTPAAGEAVLRLLGIAARAGAASPGTERVREAARAGTLQFVLIAADASDNSREKVVPLLAARRIAYAVVFDRAALGGAIGRAPVSALGITDKNLATRVVELLSGIGSQASAS